MTDTIEQVGPDLTKAEPIADVIARLAPQRNGYSADFLAACKASGMDVTVIRDRDGVDRLQIGLPEDDQTALRNQRYEALKAQLKRGKFRRQQVIDHLNLIGCFLDSQPFASAAELAEAYLAVGGRLWVFTDGRLGEALPYHRDTHAEESRNGYPLRRLVHRYAATMRRRGALEEITAHVREHGKLHEGSGCIVLEREGRADA